MDHDTLENSCAQVIVRLKREEIQDSIGFDLEEDEGLMDIKLTNEGKKIHVNNSDTSIISKNSTNSAQVFTCNQGFLHDTTQEEFFTNCGIIPLLENMIEADTTNIYHSCIMAYGQTGSGKTYTLYGSSNEASSQAIIQAPVQHETDENEENETIEVHINPSDGIIVRSLEYIFTILHTKSLLNIYNIKLSSIEIYEEQVYDLFSGSNTLPVLIKEDIIHGYTVHGCQLIDCTNLEVTIAAIELIARHRRGKHRQYNRQHSNHRQDSNSNNRQNNIHKVDHSHNIMEIWLFPIIQTINNSSSNNITNTNTNNITNTNNNIINNTNNKEINQNLYKKLTFVDLAGSERVKTSEIEGNRTISTKYTYKSLAQTDINSGSINTSLYILGKVLANLIRTHNIINNKLIPFKETILTKLLIKTLSNSYKNNSNIIITNILENKKYEKETIRSLKFIISICNINNNTINKLTKTDKLIIDLKLNIKKVKQENLNIKRTILQTPSYGDKILSHINTTDLENSLVYHINNDNNYQNKYKIKPIPKIKNTKKLLNFTTKSEKNKNWKNWNIFNKNNIKNSTIVVNTEIDNNSNISYTGNNSSSNSSNNIYNKDNNLTIQNFIPHTDIGNIKSVEINTENNIKEKKESFENNMLVYNLPTSNSNINMTNIITTSASITANNTTTNTIMNSTNNNTTTTRISSPYQLELEDLIRRRVSGPVIFHQNNTTEHIEPILQSTILDTNSAVYSMRSAEKQKSLEMKKFVTEQCKKGESQSISPYIGKLYGFYCIISVFIWVLL